MTHKEYDDLEKELKLGNKILIGIIIFVIIFVPIMIYNFK
jgi:hypothetical protein